MSFLKKGPNQPVKEEKKEEKKEESKPVAMLEAKVLQQTLIEKSVENAKPIERPKKKTTQKPVQPQKPIEKPAEPPKAPAISVEQKLYSFGLLIEALDKKVTQIQSEFNRQLTASNSNIDILRAELNKQKGVAIVDDGLFPIAEMRTVVGAWLTIRKRAEKSHGTENLVWNKLNEWYKATEPKKQ